MTEFLNGLVRYVAWLDAVPELHIEDAFAAYFVRPSLKVLARLLPASLRVRVCAASLLTAERPPLTDGTDHLHAAL